MVDNEVFQEIQEIDRLAIQNNLLKEYEKPIYDRIIETSTELKVLDIGCNNGSKSVERFGSDKVVRLVGLEYLQDLAHSAQKVYGSNRFHFYQCDVEASDFRKRLIEIMEENNIKSFDIIHISFVLMHLKKPKDILKLLKKFLAPQGKLIVVEANDKVSLVNPQEDTLFKGFLDILYQDPLSGDRECGDKVPDFLREAGYCQIVLENTMIEAEAAEIMKKNAIFETFFSYLPEDIFLLGQENPHDILYTEWKKWVDEYFEELKNFILAENTTVSMGVSMITCSGA